MVRCRYPSLFTGAIAASAPTWGLPLDSPPIDAGASFVGHGMSATCRANFKAGLVLANELLKDESSAAYVSDLLGLCSPLSPGDAASLLDFYQAPWFDLAEGNFPFPSSYIPFAVGPGNYELPAWPVKAACEPLEGDFGIATSGDPSDVAFTVSAGGVSVAVDWDVTSSPEPLTPGSLADTKVPELLQAMIQSNNLWCNITGTETCTDLHTCPTGRRRLNASPFPPSGAAPSSPTNNNNVCTVDISLDPTFNCWPSMTCNDDLNLENTLARGIGNDIYWPPSVPRGTTLESFLGPRGEASEGCELPEGLFG